MALTTGAPSANISEQFVREAPDIESYKVGMLGSAKSLVDAANQAALSGQYLTPGEKQCKFCKAKATCPALRAEVAAQVFDSAPPATAEEFADFTVVMSQDHNSDAWLAAANLAARILRSGTNYKENIPGFCDGNSPAAMRSVQSANSLSGESSMPCFF